MEEYNESSIKPQLQYEDLREEVEQKLFKSVNRDLIIMIESVGIFVIGWMISRLWSWDGDQFALTLVFSNIIGVIGIMIMLVAIIVFINCTIHITRYVKIYKADLRRIRERLSKIDIYIDIPREDIRKYDNMIKLIVISWKNREKKT